MTAELCYWNSALSDSQAEHILGAFLAAASSIPEADTIDMVKLLDDSMKEQIFEQNQKLPEATATCIHSLICQTTEANPHALAIESHDGSFTYQELDRTTNQVAEHLKKLGVGPEVPVTLCFEKSCWAIIAMVAVLKAGGVFVPIDPSFPLSRAQYIVDHVSSRILLTSEVTPPLGLRHLDHQILLSPKLIRSLPTSESVVESPVDCRNAAYIIYTSGSTGQPKGVLVEHRSVTASARAHGYAMGFTKDSRVLQSTSYSFDASIGEILTTLIHGGCLCVPTEQDRLNNLAGAIARLRPTWAFMTPTTAQTIRPQDCPSLRTVCIGGEPMTQTVKDTWGPHVQLFNGFGPSETTVACVTMNVSDTSIPPSVIGHAIGSRAWIVNHKDPRQLMPVGAVGELLIEGPIVAREYFKDPVRTKRFF